ncbi:MAG TPA: flagellar hook-basal body complex protein FliE [Plasticicumulans sp.]|uniref:flagellar hook-basal body complex protein FliE n=1 Tax=Plasticicumulans sp. TaxID=2307179 RepID=UPI002B64C492|nr:flagellar hook-basal body complex protein FliE [Plasticicumulans sp.]MBS0602724.1 flagellar hook-basal body complex protein FliE [Pseudomonadota bacterium]HMW28528.1 flagellar hook-basal body complex protein FliE [Plasticicumulans sp.]HMW41499.1 flagellar hook-basal body complex protein FliE [Plasticicumulans sp.]HND97377.1 flagellar hook-basal body complex protein FliE [Plasticicumulans sp.]HNF65207.1 flagellar hook-basal body complex protein FliE [Plasticicumulans sp.]
MTLSPLNASIAALRAAATDAGAAAGPEAGAGDADFASLLKGALDRVDARQQQASRMARAFELGEEGADLPDVMIAMQQSRLSFQSALQVRNKLVAAYQDILNMPL